MHVYPSFESLNGFYAESSVGDAGDDYFNYNKAIQAASTSILYKPWMETGYFAFSGNESFEAKQQWFDNPYSFELLPITRRTVEEGSSDEYLEEMARLLDWKIEKSLIWRAQPGYKKEITMDTKMIAGLYFLVFSFFC
jgi:hypothetical protein